MHSSCFFDRSRWLRWALALLLIVAGPFYHFVATEEVVASTTWTAAYARMAGAEDVTALAPGSMQHPPEYEIRPRDLSLLDGADLVIYGGYEVMVPRLFDALGGNTEKLLQIETGYSLPRIRDAVETIARRLGTEDIAYDNLLRFEEEVRAWRDQLERRGLTKKRVVVHRFYLPLAQELGLNLVGSYGPAPLSPREIGELSLVEPDVIIDNRHNPVAEALREVAEGAVYVQWINFPGTGGTEDLSDVVAWNIQSLEKY